MCLFELSVRVYANLLSKFVENMNRLIIHRQSGNASAVKLARITDVVTHGK